MSQPTREWQVLEHVSWTSPPLAAFQAMMRDIEARFGPPLGRDQESNGIGLYDYHQLRFACGLEVALLRFHLGPGLRSIDPLVEPSSFDIRANERDIEHIGFHLGVPAAGMSPWLDANGCSVVPAPVYRFHVMRQDDNGNQFLVKVVSSRCEADALVREYEARGHKQTYWADEKP
jgi:hypothetical protein